MAGTARYGLVFVNYDGDTLDFGDPDHYTLFARQGDWSVPFDFTYDENPVGEEAFVTYAKATRPVITIPLGIEAPSGGMKLWDIFDSLINIMRPYADIDVINAGWLYFSRVSPNYIATPDSWRIPVVPHRPSFTRSTGDPLDIYTTELQYTALSYWEADPPTANAKVLKAAGDATWSSYSFTETPGGNVHCFPVWEFDGPASGTIDTITITNTSTNKVLSFSNLGLAAGQTLQITTAFMQKDAKISGSSVYYKRSTTSDFFPLRSKTNSLTITKNATSQSAVRLTYRARRLGF